MRVNRVGAAKKVFSKFSCDTMVSGRFYRDRSQDLPTALQITGILGMKAYRCLSNSRIILAFLISVAAVMVVLLGLELSTFEGSRTIYGEPLTSVPEIYRRILTEPDSQVTVHTLRIHACCLQLS